jgi:ABC-type sugar transport system substrate-binding protein
MRALTIDFFFNSREQAFLAASCVEAERARDALRERGLEVQLAFHESGEDSDRQARQIREHADARSGAGPDTASLFIILPIKQEAVEFIARATAAHSDPRIGWAFLHQSFPEKAAEEEPALGKRVVWSVAADQAAMGALQAQQLQKLFPTKAGAREVGVIYLQGPIHSPGAYQRTRGFKRQLADAPHVTILTQMLYGEWTRDSARAALVEAEVDRLGDYATVAAAHNDDMALGMREHFREGGREGLVYVGMDGLDSLGKAKVDSGELAATVIQPLCVEETILMFLKRVAPRALNAGEASRAPEIRSGETVILPPASYPRLDAISPVSA